VKAAAAVGWRHPATMDSTAAGLPKRCGSGTAVRKDMRPARPKSLTTKMVAWPCASASSIHYSGARRICTSERCVGARRAGGSERPVRSEVRGADGLIRCVRMRTGRPNALNKSITILLFSDFFLRGFGR